MELPRTSIGEVVQEVAYGSTPSVHPAITEGGSVLSGSRFSLSSNQECGL